MMTDNQKRRSRRHISQILCSDDDMWQWKDAWAGECYLSGRHHLSYSAWVREVLYREARRIDRRCEVAQSIYNDHRSHQINYNRFLKAVMGQHKAREDMVRGIESMPYAEFAEIAHRPGWEKEDHRSRKGDDE